MHVALHALLLANPQREETLLAAPDEQGRGGDTLLQEPLLPPGLHLPDSGAHAV